MTKRARTALFFTAVFLFFITTPAAVLYSQGYRFDWEAKRVAQVGAFYVKATPPRADISVDASVSAKTDLLFGAFLTKGLIPKTYRVGLAKQGFHGWEKTLEVRAKQVTEAKNIVLVPLDPAFQVLKEGVEQFWIAPNGKEAILKKSISRNRWMLSVWNFAQRVEYPIFTSEQALEKVWSLEWAFDSSKVLLRVLSQEQIRSFVLHTDSGPAPFQDEGKAKESLDFLGKEIEDVAFLPSDPNLILFTKRIRGLLLLSKADYELEKTFPAFGNNLIAFAARNQDVFWLDAEGIVWKKNLSDDSSAQALNATPFSIAIEAEHEILILANAPFLRQQERLYRLNEETRQFEEIFSSAKQIAESPDGKNIAVSNDFEVWIYALEDQVDQPSRKKNQKIFLTRFSQKIENLVWLNPHYLIFSVENSIKIVEIDDRDRINIVDLATFPDPILFWQDETKTLFVHTESRVLASENLLP